MPTPVSSNSAPIMPHVENAADGPPHPAQVVTVPPVYIEGNAGSRHPGVTQLVNAHDAAAATQNCQQQGRSAVVGTVPMGAAVLGTLAAAASGPLGIAAGLLTLFGASIYEGKELRSYYECKTE